MGRIQLRILEVLDQHGPMAGGEIPSKDKRILRGTVHTTLYRMAEEGLVKGVREKGGIVPGHPRVFYSITPRGHAELVAARAAEAIREGRTVLIDGREQ